MGTRNLTLVVKDEQIRVAQYCQWDGYPSGQGVTVHNFIINEMTPQFREQIDRLTELSPEAVRSRWESVGAKGEMVSMDIADKFNRKFAHLNRDMGAKILSYIQAADEPEVALDTEFAADSLFCEWAYLLDLDNDTLEVYRGFNKESLHATERFKFLESAEQNDEYKPIKLLAKFSFKELKKTWSDQAAWANHLQQLAYPEESR